MDNIIYIELLPAQKSTIIRLPHVFDKNHKKNLYIAVQSISLHLRPSSPSFGKLKLEQLDGFHSGLVQDKILDIFKIGYKDKVAKDRKVLNYVKLSDHVLSKLEVSLLDEENEAIRLSKKSFVVLRLKNMEQEYNSFTIHVNKEGKRQISKFKHTLPHQYT